jgi:hypothetical protein
MNKESCRITIDPSNEIFFDGDALLPGAPSISYVSFKGAVYKDVHISAGRKPRRDFQQYFDLGGQTGIFSEPVAIGFCRPEDENDLRRIPGEEFYSAVASMLKLRFVLSHLSRKYRGHAGGSEAVFLAPDDKDNIGDLVKYVHRTHGIKISGELAYSIARRISADSSMPGGAHPGFREALSRQFAWYKQKSGAARNELYTAQARIMDTIIGKERKAAKESPCFMDTDEAIIAEEIKEYRDLLFLKDLGKRREA